MSAPKEEDQKVSEKGIFFEEPEVEDTEIDSEESEQGSWEEGVESKDGSWTGKRGPNTPPTQGVKGTGPQTVKK